MISRQFMVSRQKESAAENPPHFAILDNSRHRASRFKRLRVNCRSIRADRPAPARAPVAAAHCGSDEAKASATTPATTATTAPAAASATSAATASAARFCRCGSRRRDEQCRADHADRINEDQSQRRKTALEEVRTCRVLGHMKNLQFPRSALNASSHLSSHACVPFRHVLKNR